MVKRAAVAVASVLACASCAAPASAPGSSTAAPGGSSASCTTASVTASAPDTGALLGVSIDWASDSLADYAERLGRAPAVAVTFSQMPLREGDHANIAAGAAQAAAQGGRLLLTLEPNDGLATVNREAVAHLVGTLRSVNDTGVPVAVRFAHEMNGSWYAWGQQPKAYVKTFRAVARAVHEGAPGLEHDVGPELRRRLPVPRRRPRGHGRLQGREGPRHQRRQGSRRGGRLVRAVLPRGRGRRLPIRRGGRAGRPRLLRRLRHDHGKPVAITETGAFYVPGGGGAKESTIKRAWWRQAFAPDLLIEPPG